MRKSTLATLAISVAAATMTVQAASAQTAEPVKVGIIDTSVDKLMMGYKGVAVTRRTFVEEGRTPGSWQGMIGSSHGEIVASSFVEKSREIDKATPIAIYSANAFYENGPRNGEGNRPMSIDFKGAEKALEWFHDNGVRTVVTAFYTKDGPGMRAFMKKAEDLDIVLFAGTNNDKTSTIPFPARDGYAIAVTGANANLDFANNPEMSKWTAFKINGDTPTNDMLATSENGSSFAVAKAAAFGAHYVRMNPTAKRDDVVTTLRSVAAGKRGNVSDLDGGGVTKKFRTTLSMPLRSITKGPVVVMASASAPQVVAARDGR